MKWDKVGRYFFTDDELLEILKRRSKALGRTIPGRFMRIPGELVYRKRFGSWNRALELAGLPLNLRQNLKSSIKSLSEWGRAYLAGIIDADGYVCVDALEVGVANTDDSFLRHLRDICGGGNIYSKISRGNSHYGIMARKKTLYQLRFNRNELRDLLPQIVEFLFIKKGKATIVINRLGNKRC